ncbi:hypothetical protein ALC60_07948, partial [Trachymyrmex zeteki]
QNTVLRMFSIQLLKFSSSNGIVSTGYTINIPCRLRISFLIFGSAVEHWSDAYSCPSSDMDMLQLFASPAGRALLTSDNRARGSTSTSSLSRESSSRLKSSRRPSGTGTVSAPTSPPRRRKSSAELYKEAVEILGLTCSLTDSCRCIDCQSNYFDCDDDCADAGTELAAGTPILLDHALSHHLTVCSIQ